MIRLAVPLAILAVLLLPLPYALCFFVFSALLAVRPRGRPSDPPALLFTPVGSPLLRSPPR
jgi:hypothetical protein